VERAKIDDFIVLTYSFTPIQLELPMNFQRFLFYIPQALLTETRAIAVENSISTSAFIRQSLTRNNWLLRLEQGLVNHLSNIKRAAILSQPFVLIVYFEASGSALRELEATAGFGLAVFLTFNGTAVTGEEAALFEGRAKVRLKICKGARNAVAHGAGLARKSTTDNGALNVHLGIAINRDHRLLNQHPQNRASEVSFNDFAIYGHLAGAALDPDASNRVLAAAGCVGAAFGINLWLGRGSGSSRICSNRHSHGSAQVRECRLF
jgi:hypothetical protein